VMSYLRRNAENSCKVVRHTVAAMPKTRSCKCGSALAYAILTDRSKIPADTRRKLSLLLDKYLKTQEAGA
jgi:5'-methylthioadenosine phosphorylase